MLPLPIIPMAVRNLPWRLVGAGLIVLGLLGVGFWFKGVLADRDKLAVQAEAQAEQIKNLNDEADRMAKQDAADYALRQNIEAQKVQLAADLATNQRNLKKAKGLLDAITQNCLDMPLPDAYLNRLPMPPDQRD